MTKLLISLFALTILNLNTLYAAKDFAVFHLDQDMTEKSSKAKAKTDYYAETLKMFEQSERALFEELPSYFIGRCFMANGEVRGTLLLSGTFTEDKNLGPVFSPKTYNIVNIFQGSSLDYFDRITPRMKSHMEKITKDEVKQYGADLIVDKRVEGLGAVFVIRKFNDYFTAIVEAYRSSNDEISKELYSSCYFYEEPEVVEN
ncbi:MAG: hypothetical protein VX642_12705 [Bdellovibrionota bacterium]|nr:hypothetical protein [Bdellovibrionota bacterium]